MRAIQITEFGGPEVLNLVDLPDLEAKAGHVLIDVTAAGVNYADTHQAENSYLAPQELPLVPGAEVVGTAQDGRRVVALLGSGGYASQALANQAVTFDIPDSVSDGAAASLVLQGLTAWHLLKTSAQIREGESVVVHAAAGGVGSIAVQLAKRFGAGTVIGTASSQDKRDLAIELGADIAIDSRAEDMNAAIREAAGGKVDVVIDMTGGATTDGSLAALAPFGRLAFYGMASRENPSPVHLGALMAKSQGVIGFWLAHAMMDPMRLVRPAMEELVGLVAAGELHPVEGGSYPMSEARRAHEDIRGRGTVGKLILDPAN